MEYSAGGRARGRWIAGGTLILLGLAFLFMNMGYMERFTIWNFWPVILIAIGLNKFFVPYNKAEGFWLMSIGAWLQISLMHWWGLGFSETWPALLIALGVFWMWESAEKESRKRRMAQEIQAHTAL